MATSDWEPTVAGVGALLRARTRDRNGDEVGTFTRDTRPTDVQVSELIRSAVGDITSATGRVEIPTFAYGTATSVATAGAAMLIELSFFPEQVASGKSPYAQLETRYTQQLAALTRMIDVGGGTVVGDRSPAYDFRMGEDPAVVTTPIAGWRAAW